MARENLKKSGTWHCVKDLNYFLSNLVITYYLCGWGSILGVCVLIIRNKLQT